MTTGGSDASNGLNIKSCPRKLWAFIHLSTYFDLNRSESVQSLISMITGFFYGCYLSALDDKVSALQWLQYAYEHHENEMPWLISEPQFYSLHDEPTFQELVEKVGFPVYK